MAGGGAAATKSQGDLRLAASSAPASPGALQSAALESSEASIGLYVPQTGSTQRLPLLVFLHGLGGSGHELREHLHLVALSESKGFALLSPDGPLDFSGRRYWNATESCCDFDGNKPDHVAELRRWIETAERHPRVDARRVYLIGFSNGGFLAHRAGCELAPLLHGIVSIAGAAPGKRERCEAQAPLNVLEIHGTADPIVAFTGGYLFANTRYPPYPSVADTLKRWARSNGCSERQLTKGTLDLDPSIVGGETEVSAFEGCPQARVELWKIVGGNHTSGLSRASLDAIWAFITSLAPKPE
jgi:polyhydroxybutyrate depolymerase